MLCNSLTPAPRHGLGMALGHPGMGGNSTCGCPHQGFYPCPPRMWLWWEERKGECGTAKQQPQEKGLEGHMEWKVAGSTRNPLHAGRAAEGAPRQGTEGQGREV